MLSQRAQFKPVTFCHQQNLSQLKLRRQKSFLQLKQLQVQWFEESMRCAKTGGRKEHADTVTSAFLHMETMNYHEDSP